jgi:hypothetical protein
VIASESSALKNNLAGAAELVEAMDVGALKTAVQRLLRDGGPFFDRTADVIPATAACLQDT